MDSGHVHTGFVAFVFGGVSALVFFNVWKIVAARAALSNNPTIANIGTSAGALVHFGG